MIQQASWLVPERIECGCGIAHVRIRDGNTKRAYKQVSPTLTVHFYILKKFIYAWKEPFTPFPNSCCLTCFTFLF